MAIYLFTLGFGTIFLMDQAYYQNHLYLVVLVGTLFTLFGLRRGEQARLWMVDLMRAQVGIVYVFGGIAKINADWLAGEPMTQWMAIRADWAIIDLWSDIPARCGMFIVGMLFDLAIVPLLLWRRTRMWAFAGVVLFHGLNAILFKIGVFPVLMLASRRSFSPQTGVSGKGCRGAGTGDGLVGSSGVPALARYPGRRAHALMGDERSHGMDRGRTPVLVADEASQQGRSGGRSCAR